MTLCVILITSSLRLLQLLLSSIFIASWSWEHYSLVRLTSFIPSPPPSPNSPLHLPPTTPLPTLYHMYTHQVVVKFLHQISLLTVKAVEDTLEDTLSHSKTTSTFSERTFLDAVRTLGMVLSECETRVIFAVMDTEKKGAISVDDIMDFALKGKNPHARRAREGPM